MAIHHLGRTRARPVPPPRCPEAAGLEELPLLRALAGGRLPAPCYAPRGEMFCVSRRPVPATRRAHGCSGRRAMRTTRRRRARWCSAPGGRSARAGARPPQCTPLRASAASAAWLGDTRSRAPWLAAPSAAAVECGLCVKLRIGRSGQSGRAAAIFDCRRTPGG